MMHNDEAMIERALAGDHAAFEALVEVYWPVAERTAVGVLRDAQLAQDVAQDVFADIYVQRARFHPRYSFRACVVAMARYKSIDLLRRRRCPVPLDEIDPPDVRTPESEFIESLFRSTLYNAVERLPEQHRRMLTAYALEDRSYRDIASELGISVAQVKITLHRIRKQLRRIRDDWENG